MMYGALCTGTCLNVDPQAAAHLEVFADHCDPMPFHKPFRTTLV